MLNMSLVSAVDRFNHRKLNEKCGNAASENNN